MRAWRSGDSARRIHASATSRMLARGMEPVVTEWDPPGYYPRRVVVLFHSHGTDRTLIRPELFERALSLVCGTLDHLLRMGIPAVLKADFLSWSEMECRSRKELAECFALLARVRRYGQTEAHDIQEQLLEVEMGDAIVRNLPS